MKTIPNAFIPEIGMQPENKEGNGYKGVIEYVGKDYFILRSFKTGEPIFIKEFQYHNFTDYSLKSLPEETRDKFLAASSPATDEDKIEEHEEWKEGTLPPIFNEIFDLHFPQIK